MATSDKLQKLLETKEQIRQAIIDKGVEVGDDVVFADYSNKIAAIETSGGSDDFLALRTNNHTNYSHLFEGYKEDSLEPFALDTWDTSNVTDMDHMFSICKVKDYNLSNWDFSKVADTHNMFNYSDAVNIDLSNWRVGPEIESIDMSQMFVGCYDLETLDIRNFNIADCNLKNSFTGNAFQYCNKLHTLRLDNCSKDTINKIITSIGFPTGLVDGEPRKIYVNPDNIGDLPVPKGWIFVDSDGNEIVPGIPLYQPDMFSGNIGIEEVNVMVTSEHDDLNGMFSDCENLRTINGINEWDTSNVTNMERMFNSCRSLESLDLSSFNTSNVESMSDMFSDCRNLKELNLSSFEIRGHCDTFSMLNNCRKLHTLRLDNCNEDTIRKIIESFRFPTGEAEDYEGTRKIHVNPDNIGDLTAPDDWIFVDLDGNEIVPEIPVCEYCGEPGCDGSCQDNGEKPYIVATFGTDESVDMLGEPSGYWKASFDNGTTWKNNDDNMTKGNEIVYLKPKDTSNIRIFRLFEDSSYVTHIEFHNFSAYPVYPYADYMFNNCSNLTELDLSSLNFSNGMGTLEGMFSNCNNLESLNLSSWSLYANTNTSNMFKGCNSLHILRLDNCNESTIRKIIFSSGFPTGDIGVARQIFVKANVSNLTEPDGWDFVNVE